MEINPSSETPLIPTDILEAAKLGWHMADQAVRTLEDSFPGKRVRLKTNGTSENIFMEFAAVIRLRGWFDAGLLDFLPDSGDGLFAAMDISEETFTRNPDAFKDSADYPPLTAALLDVWEKHLAWCGSDELDADVVLDHSPSDDDQILHGIADFLWSECRGAGD